MNAVVVAVLVVLAWAGVYLLRVALAEADELDSADRAEREYEARRNRRLP